MGNPLYQTTSAVADVNGNVDIYFAGPGSGRVWQGTISIILGPAGTDFVLTIGGQKFGVINSPGPGGPFQFLPNQSVNISASLVTPGTTFSAIISGVDDPQESATPYTGPFAVTSVSTGSP